MVKLPQIIVQDSFVPILIKAKWIKKLFNNFQLAREGVDESVEFLSKMVAAEQGLKPDLKKMHCFIINR